jgi:hypothetical protein
MANETKDAPVAPAEPLTQSPKSSPNHRRAPRRRVLKDGKVIFGMGHSVVDCTIDNVSDGGAHIRINSSHGVPEEFYLVETTRQVIHRAAVAWRSTTGLGLRLLGPIEDVAQREAFLRKFKR